MSAEIVAIEGELTVRLDWDGQRVKDAVIRSTRPFAASRLLLGKSPARAAATVAMLYSVCGVAQRAAATGALAAAGAKDVDADSARSERAVALETIQEHFWRLLIDWPQAMGREADATPVAAARYRIAAAAGAANGHSALEHAAAMRRLGAELSRLAARAIFGLAPAEWLGFADLSALAQWTAAGRTECAKLLAEIQAQIPTLGRSNVGLMPDLTRDSLFDVILPELERDPDFVRVPTWAGVPVETGALARVRTHPMVAALIDATGHTVATRLVARLVDLAALLVELNGDVSDASPARRVQSFPLAPAGGVAAVLTARGLLVHRVRLDGGCVADYRVVAPTEWNFHPQGALAQGLAGMRADDRLALQQRARLVVQALDPCVACSIEVADA